MMQHSLAQTKMFFAIAQSLGYDSEEIKKKAKSKFGKEHFSDLTSEEMNYLIDKLKSLQAEMTQLISYEVD